MKTVIMAGGKGTRISSLFPDIPKPLIPIKDSRGISKPILEWEILSLASQGFTDIILTVSYMHEKIEEYFGDGSQYGIKISYFVEEIPLGNAGALFKLQNELGQEPFLLLIADAMFDVDFTRMVLFHKEHNALVTLFTHPNSHPYDSSLLITDSNNAVTEWLTKEDPRPEFYKNRVNAGLQVIDPAVLLLSGINPETVGEKTQEGKTIRVDMDRQILKPLCGTGRIYCYDSPEYCKDMGTPERFMQVNMDFQNGIVKAKNLSQKQKAIFLDRDGTINKLVGFLRSPDEFELLDGVAEAIRHINGSGYLAIVVTNQPVIARGEVTVAQLDEIHNKLETLLGVQGAYIDALYYCPHHPDKGFEGEIAELKIQCNCRKPKPGMLFQAAEDYNIDLEQSWMIGDGEFDVRCGKSAGCRTVLISESKEDFGQTITTDSLLSAIGQIFGD